MTPSARTFLREVALVSALALGGCKAGARELPGSIPSCGQGGTAGGGSPTGGAAGAGSEAGVRGIANETSYPFDAGDCIAPAQETKCQDGWCKIPAGCFIMGSPPDEWGHPAAQEDQVAVTLTHSFLIQQTEVTLDQWIGQGLRSPPNAADGGGDCMQGDCPVGNVTWFDAVAYANLLSEHHNPALKACYKLQGCTGELGHGLNCQVETTAPTVYGCEGFRLPTDAEWEYAARAGTTSAFYSGPITVYGDWLQNSTACSPDPNLEQIGWYCLNSGGMSHPVRGLQPNAWGLYDVAGNAGEWINDRSDGAGALSPVDPDGTVDNHPWRNVRGGWFSTWASTCRMAQQSSFTWDSAYAQLGFRLARSLPR
jgi:sulfatase modifying factor 1